jgi:hypothetical protein
LWTGGRLKIKEKGNCDINLGKEGAGGWQIKRAKGVGDWLIEEVGRLAACW